MKKYALAGMFGFFLLIILLIEGYEFVCEFQQAFEDSLPEHEEWFSTVELETELERKWDVDVSLYRMQDDPDHDARLWHFVCEEGVMFTVTGSRSYYIYGGSSCDYQDNYLAAYINAHPEELIAPLTEKGYEIWGYPEKQFYTYPRIEKSFYLSISTADEIAQACADIENLSSALPESSESAIRNEEAELIRLRCGNIRLRGSACAEYQDDFQRLVKEGVIAVPAEE